VLSAEEIAGLYKQRAARLSARHARMREVSDVYYGRTQLPLPELSKNEKAAVPNLCRQGTDQLALRAALVLPNLDWPSLRPGIDIRDQLADTRRRVNYGWWEANNYPRITARRARRLITYASGPVAIRPDESIMKGGGPRWETLNPFDVFPSFEHEDCITPTDTIITHVRTADWLKTYAPEAWAKVRKRPEGSADDTYTCLEYITAKEIVWCLCGHQPDQNEMQWGTPPAMESSAALMGRPVPNRAGMNWVVIPEQTCLDAPAGKFDDILGMYAYQAAMMALQILAARKAIWPEMWFVNPNTMATPHIAQSPDPRTGTPGKLVNGIIDRAQLDPGFQGMQTIDHLEYNMRQTAGLPAELGGSGSQNVRTGKRGNQIMSASIDFTIAEVQNAIADSAKEENLRAAAIDKAYFNTSKTMYVSWKSTGKVTYKPSEAFEDDAHCVTRYPIAGTDLSDLVINAGQRVGMGTMSKRSFMDIDPLVDDPDGEQKLVMFEALEAAALTAIQTLAANPDGPMQLPDYERIYRKVFAEDMSLFDAIAAVQEEKQAEQAQGAPMGAPETMPGLAMPGQGAEVPAGIPGLGPGSEDMTALLSQLGVADQAVRMR
jgi:hypothetical protein